MATVACASLVAGALLGLRFKVLVLLPVIVVWLGVAVAVGMAYAGELVAVLMGLQIGYLVGAAVAFSAVRNRLAPHACSRTMAGAVATRPPP